VSTSPDSGRDQDLFDNEHRPKRKDHRQPSVCGMTAQGFRMREPMFFP
jgi:hypothetical protein